MELLDADPELRLPIRPKKVLPREPGAFLKLIPGTMARYERKKAEALSIFLKAERRHQLIAQRRAARYKELCNVAAKENEDVRNFRTAYQSGDPEAVAAFVKLALDGSELPDGFYLEHRIAYMPENRQLVLDYRMPTLDEVIPAIERYKYVKARDCIEEVARSTRSQQMLYTDLVAQLTLRVTSEAFRADQDGIIFGIVFNAFVDTIDRATGQQIRPYLVSLRTTREQFSGLDLRQVEPTACLKHLSAAISRSPAELLPVKPILEFDMVDPRFVEESDILSALDNRPNLMELSPGEFESLITNLFQAMGLDTKLTRASRDGGVDCVAYDPRPILGGKIVIQAKRYKNTVGVSAVRDLFGTMHNEGASKGILVTTSGYGSAAYEFANGKPIELISGSNLLYLLKEHASVEAKIEAPPDWTDPLEGA